MSAINETTTPKNNKKIYAKPQIAKILFPAGFGEVALKEVETILGDLWLAKPFKGTISRSKNAIVVRQVYLHALVELMSRSHCISDIRLVVYKGMAIGKKAFEKKCREVVWSDFFNKTMSINIKVDSVSSTAFHETALREIVAQVVKDHVLAVVTADQATATGIYVDYYKDKLTLSISLAGKGLYRRGYRTALDASAPLREDIAACCIKKALSFASALDETYCPDVLFVPFSGTGTFVFEFIQVFYSIAPILFKRHYALELMPWFKKQNLHNLIKMTSQKFRANQKVRVICVDSSVQANLTLTENKKNVISALKNDDCLISPMDQYMDDFFSLTMSDLMDGMESVLILLNPPYGIRLQHQDDTVALYKNIAIKVNEISALTKKYRKKILGVILCPNEATWSSFCRHLSCSNMETYHMTQGGLDIRVCQFYV